MSLWPWGRRRRREEELRRTLEAEAGVDKGFHRDSHVLELADFFLGQSDAFVETGALAGTTALYVGRRYGKPVYSCEPHPISHAFAVARCRDVPGISIAKERSPQFLYDLFRRHPELAEKRLTFWLDAHSYGFGLPLLKEAHFITRTVSSAFIMIDDFKVPGRPEFGYSVHKKKAFSLEYIASGMAPREYHVILPTYAEEAAARRLRGVGTLVFGVDGFALPEKLGEAFSVEPYKPPT